ncbi:MAG: methyltransferase domain-containing protein [Candidatus Bathyarchaeota archaeon]|nr:methyltransferase domain-containing protein [Candidatus Bathyarchaeota archaeon]
MGINLQVLGMQSIPLLAEKLGVHVSFPEHVFSTPMRLEEFQTLLKDCGKILESFFEEYKISWRDVYVTSDIGLERMALAQEMQLDEHDTVLDVGCGRGYFTIAAAELSRFVIGVDLMNGLGRHGWWRNFNTSIRELNLVDKVLGVKSDGGRLPFRSGSFSAATTVHAIRNFKDYSSIENAIKEMKRVVLKGGSVILVESLPIARTKAQEAHLQMFRCKVKHTYGELDYLSKDKIEGIFQNVGFKKLEVKELDYNLSAAPPLFCIDPYLPSLPRSKREEAKRAYDRAASMVSKWGEVSPPALLVRATR